jgi:hypothetical protein
MPYIEGKGTAMAQSSKSAAKKPLSGRRVDASKAARTGKKLVAEAGKRNAMLLDKQGQVTVDGVVDAFGLSKLQIARSLGLPKEAVHKRSRISAPKTQQRLKEMLEIVSRVSAWSGGQIQAMAWYRSQSISALGDQTAEALVKAGKADVVREYLDGIALGGFA